MAQRMALYLQDKHPIQYEIEMVKYAEEMGFSEIWQADTRLARDCVVMMSAFLAETKRHAFWFGGTADLDAQSGGYCGHLEHDVGTGGSDGRWTKPGHVRPWGLVGADLFARRCGTGTAVNRNARTC